MSDLEDQVAKARKEIKSDGYEMSIGEISNLYREGELQIDPEYQRLFRWDITRKTRFVESLLLGIPIPPIFVFQGRDGVWELIDGLQRLSTVFQLMGILKGPRAAEIGSLILEGTTYLPELSGKSWDETGPDAQDGLGSSLQIQIKRSRIRVEILQPESDATAKFELFQRLNTGGAGLSEQEIRNCVAVMIDKEFFDWLKALSEVPSFRSVTDQTEVALEAQIGMELALRVISFSHWSYNKKLDVHEYLDAALIGLANDQAFDRNTASKKFRAAFDMLNDALASSAFKRWDGVSFKGKFLMSVFEVMATSAYLNSEALQEMSPEDRTLFIRDRAVQLWSREDFKNNSGGGVRGTTRLLNLLPMAIDYLKP